MEDKIVNEVHKSLKFMSDNNKEISQEFRNDFMKTIFSLKKEINKINNNE